MVGEIRDLETAEMAIQSRADGAPAVLSSLHTNDAPSAVARLLDLGVPSYLLNSTVLGVMAQRLVRTLCPHCKGKTPFGTEERNKALERHGRALKGEPRAKSIARPVAWNAAIPDTWGRIGIYEILLLTSEIKKFVTEASDVMAPDRASLQGRNEALCACPVAQSGARFDDLGRSAEGRTTWVKVGTGAAFGELCLQKPRECLGLRKMS